LAYPSQTLLFSLTPYNPINCFIVLLTPSGQRRASSCVNFVIQTFYSKQ